jgi:hypothetical protein
LNDGKIKKINSKKRNMALDKYLEVPSYATPLNTKRALNPPKSCHPSIGRLFKGRAIHPGQKIVATNFKNRISMQPTRRSRVME